MLGEDPTSISASAQRLRRFCLFVSLASLLTTAPGRAAASDPLVRLETVATGLALPVFVTHAGDGSDRLFILEQTGRIRIFKDGQLRPQPFLNITPLVESGGEKGLLGLAFHPQYRINGRFFVNYTRGRPLRTVIAEYQVSPDPDEANPAEKVLLEIGQPFDNHNGGMIAFGPDGYLYIGMGDGGSAGDPLQHAQNLDSLLGKILRIDVDGPSPYAVPASNPFANRGGVRPEIWASGLRNPWRFSFDRVTGRLFAGDVGQGTLEEVDLVIRGENYGWNLMEGTGCFRNACSREGLSLPIAEYGRDLGISVTGGYVYRGTLETPLRGAYLFGDYGSSRIWSLTEKGGGVWQRTELLKPDFNISSFGEDEQGDLYVVHHAGSGSVRRMLFGSTQVFAMVPDGGGYTSTLTVTNTSKYSTQATLRFFNSGGAPRPLTIAGFGTNSRFNLEIPPGGVRVLRTSGDGAASGGMALLESTPTARATATFQLNRGGAPSAAASVLDSRSAARFTVPFDNGAGAATGLAIANPGDAPIHVQLTLADINGVEVETIAPPALNPLPPKGQVALFLSELGFRGHAAVAQGTLRVSVQAQEEAAVTSLLLKDGLLTVVPVY